MSGRLAGKVALVTGAARGTGAETARLFAEEGARVVLADVLDDLGAETASDIGDAALYRHLDVTDEADWATVVAGVEAELGGIDVLVNNAAVLEVAALTEIATDRARQLLDVNLLGPFHGMRAVVEPMRRRGGGSIVNVSSVAGFHGENGVSVYAATKWGLRGLTKSSALELGQHGIRVNAVCPGGGSDEMAAPYRAELEARVRAGERFAFEREPMRALGRRGDLRELAHAVLFLASDDSSFVTGADLVVDGGATVGLIHPGAPGAPPV